MKGQRKLFAMMLVLAMISGLTACGGGPSQSAPANTSKPPAEGKANAEKSDKTTGIKIKVTAGGQVLTATLTDNATSRGLVAKFPLTVRMMDLYAREMCYRFAEPLPADEAQTSGYEAGDLSYWTPGRSLVIFYRQNGEVIGNLQKIGRFDSSVEFFQQTGDVDVKFELVAK